MKIYVAGPLFTLPERRFNSELAWLLRNYGHEVFLPQEHGLKPTAARSPKEIFLVDVAGIDQCDVVVACIDGPDPDSGVAWELGYAYAKRKKTIAYRTDTRLYDGQDKVNLMLTESASSVLYLPDADIDKLADLINYQIAKL